MVDHLIAGTESQASVLSEYNDIKRAWGCHVGPTLSYTDPEPSTAAEETSGAEEREAFVAQLVFKEKKVSKRGLYCFGLFGEDEGLEGLVEQDAKLPAKVRYIESNARAEQKRIEELMRP